MGESTAKAASAEAARKAPTISVRLGDTAGLGRSASCSRHLCHWGADRRVALLSVGAPVVASSTQCSELKSLRSTGTAMLGSCLELEELTLSVTTLPEASSRR
jgi:hypothetical protein